MSSNTTSGRKRGKGIIVVFLAPAILLYVFLFLYPAGDAFRVSMYDWSGFNFDKATYVGLENFRDAFDDRWLGVAFTNNMLIMFAGGILLFTFALFFAVVLANRKFKGRTFFKTAIFLPLIINPVAIGYLWIFILQPRFGLLNTFLRSVGLDDLALPWLGDRTWALAWVIFVIVWYFIGFYMVLLIAGIDGIPKEIYDAAKVDGASGWQLFWRVTLPMLRDVLAVAIIYWMISSMQTFGVVWAMTQGGPANATHTMTTYLMFQAIPTVGSPIFRMGYGTAIAVLLFFLVFIISLLFFRLSRREAIEY